MLSNVPQHRARLPLRVQIKPTDTTGSIISTVKNFYGLYEGEGVSFENSNGITLIAQYENLTDQATVHVRVINELPTVNDTRHAHRAISPRKPRLDEPFKMLPPQPYSRPSSRSAKKRTESPLSGRGYRGGSARVQPGPAQVDNDAANSFSDSDAGSVSVSSSRKAKAENVASAEISIDNIVEGGRRKRAKFESSVSSLYASALPANLLPLMDEWTKLIKMSWLLHRKLLQVAFGLRRAALITSKLSRRILAFDWWVFCLGITIVYPPTSADDRIDVIRVAAAPHYQPQCRLSNGL